MAIKEYRDGRERRTAAMLPEVFDQVRKIAHYENRSLAYQLGMFVADGVAEWVEKNGPVSEDGPKS